MPATLFLWLEKIWFREKCQKRTSPNPIVGFDFETEQRFLNLNDFNLPTTEQRHWRQDDISVLSLSGRSNGGEAPNLCLGTYTKFQTHIKFVCWTLGRDQSKKWWLEFVHQWRHCAARITKLLLAALLWLQFGWNNWGCGKVLEKCHSRVRIQDWVSYL